MKHQGSSVQYSLVRYWMSSAFHFYNAPKNASLTMREAKRASYILKEDTLSYLIIPIAIIMEILLLFRTVLHNSSPFHLPERSFQTIPCHWPVVLSGELDTLPFPRRFLATCSSKPPHSISHCLAHHNKTISVLLSSVNVSLFSPALIAPLLCILCC